MAPLAAFRFAMASSLDTLPSVSACQGFPGQPQDEGVSCVVVSPLPFTWVNTDTASASFFAKRSLMQPTGGLSCAQLLAGGPPAAADTAGTRTSEAAFLVGGSCPTRPWLRTKGSALCFTAVLTCSAYSPCDPRRPSGMPCSPWYNSTPGHDCLALAEGLDMTGSTSVAHCIAYVHFVTFWFCPCTISVDSEQLFWHCRSSATICPETELNRTL
mmetsp:Transcript_83663/g.218482  ORF Transcript_83663/g.218482 Transcript_83663/m.218482 type:complete len:214 (+) Transcript_83663:336-977(+)